MMSHERDADNRGEEQSPTLLVGVSRPETTAGLMELAWCLASRAGYHVIATHVVEVPPQANLGAVRGSREVVQAREKLLGAIREAAGRDVPVKGVVEIARDVGEGLISAAEKQGAELLLVGYSEMRDDEAGESGERRFDRVMHRVARSTKADLVVARFRREQVESILLPINTGLNIAVSGKLARAISLAREAPVTLLHLLAEDETEHEVRTGLEDVLEDNDMADLGELVIEEPPDDLEPLQHMLELVNRHDLAIVGADPRPSIAESLFGSWAERIAREAECTVLVVRAKSVEDKG